MFEMKFSRRTQLAFLLATPLALALTGCDSGTPSKPTVTPGGSDKAIEPTVSIAELMKDGPLPEQVLGNANAPVTIVEYASMTCTHCATFHNESFAHLKEKYIDTGKVRYVFREFPLDPLAYAGSLLARCAGEGKYFPMIEMLFKQQRAWTSSPQPEAALLQLARQAGFTQDSFNACLQDQTSYSLLQQVRQRAVEKFGVDSTPSFFINGKIFRGALAPAQLDLALEPFLAAKK